MVLKAVSPSNIKGPILQVGFYENNSRNLLGGILAYSSTDSWKERILHCFLWLKFSQGAGEIAQLFKELAMKAWGPDLISQYPCKCWGHIDLHVIPALERERWGIFSTNHMIIRATLAASKAQMRDPASMSKVESDRRNCQHQPQAASIGIHLHMCPHTWTYMHTYHT